MKESRPDLGISGILDSKDKSKVEDSVSEKPAADLKEKEAISSSSAPTELLKLKKAENWKAIAHYCETRITGSAAEDGAYRIWWVNAQFQEESVPLSMLIAPLQSALVELDERGEGISSFSMSSLRKLAASLLTEFARAFAARGDKDLAETCRLKAEKLTGSELSIEESVELKDEKKRPVKQRKKRSFGSVLVLLIGLILIGGGSYSWYRSTNSSRLAPIKAAVEVSAPDIKGPDSERVASLKHLDAVFYDAQTDQKTASTGGTASRPVKNTSPANTRREKEDLDMTGPVEPEEVFELMQKGSSAESTESGRGASQVTKSPKKMFPSLQTFPKEYKILSRTNVLNEPKYTGKVVGSLAVGDTVTAIDRKGIWLKLKPSPRNAEAYILDQDAVPAE